MYCVKCGVKLEDGQGLCPVCNTKVFHPDFPVDYSRSAYPVKEFKSEELSRKSLMFVITILMLLPMFLPMIFELTWKYRITWSGMVMGGVLLFYIIFVLPFWFKSPNPVIFAPCDFAAISLYILYISLITDGSWFLSFALPIILSFGAIICAMTTLLRYLKRGKLYVYGAGLIAIGAWTGLIEFLIKLTFGVSTSVKWSIFSFTSLFIIGMLLIIIAIIKPFKEALKKIFYY